MSSTPGHGFESIYVCSKNTKNRLQGYEITHLELGSCDSFNVNQPYCANNQEECTEFFNDCMLLASGELHDKVIND